MNNYLNETLYVDIDLVNKIPVGTIGEYVEPTEKETAFLLGRRLNTNTTFNTHVDTEKCTEHARFLRGEVLKGYLVESVKNNLPAWDRSKHLPAEKLQHIITNHTLRGRFGYLMQGTCGDYIKDKFGNRDYNRAMESIPKKLSSGATLDRVEEAIAQYIENWAWTMDKKDFFPRHMSEQQIIKAIREAYEDAARKISKRQSSIENTSDGTRSKEVILYQGVTQDGMVIHFRFDFENEWIDTAYPKLKSPKGIRKDKLPK